MSAVEFRLARPEEKQRVLDFVNANFDWRLPLVNRPEEAEKWEVEEVLAFLAQRRAQQGGRLPQR